MYALYRIVTFWKEFSTLKLRLHGSDVSGAGPGSFLSSRIPADFLTRGAVVHPVIFSKLLDDLPEVLFTPAEPLWVQIISSVLAASSAAFCHFEFPFSSSFHVNLSSLSPPPRSSAGHGSSRFIPLYSLGNTDGPQIRCDWQRWGGLAWAKLTKLPNPFSLIWCLIAAYTDNIKLLFVPELL